jgi:hypothetical protein
MGRAAVGRGENAVATIVSNLVTIWGLLERDPGVQADTIDVFDAPRERQTASPGSQSGAFGSPQLMQAMCLQAAFRLGVEQTAIPSIADHR